MDRDGTFRFNGGCSEPSRPVGEHIGSVTYNFLSAVDHALGHGINRFTKPVERSALELHGRIEIVSFGNLGNTVGVALILPGHVVLQVQGSHWGRQHGLWRRRRVAPYKPWSSVSTARITSRKHRQGS